MKPRFFPVPLLCCLVLAMPVFAEEKAAEPPKPMEETPPPDTAGPADPFAPSGPGGRPAATDIQPTRANEIRPSVMLRVETWEVPGTELAHKEDAGQSAADIAKWREEWLTGKDSVQLVFSPQILLNAATRMTGESVTETIYPTEYEPPSLGTPLPPPPPPTDSTKPKTLLETIQASLTKATPTAFTTRNTGQTLEAMAKPVGAEKGYWDVSSTLEDVAQAGFISSGAPEIDAQMPRFTSFRTGGVVRLKEREWQVLSVLTPPHDTNGSRPKTRWVTLMRIDPVRE